MANMIIKKMQNLQEIIYQISQSLIKHPPLHNYF